MVLQILQILGNHFRSKVVTPPEGIEKNFRESLFSLMVFESFSKKKIYISHREKSLRWLIRCVVNIEIVIFHCQFHLKNIFQFHNIIKLKLRSPW